MIVLDTHIWLWWVDNNPRLTRRLQEIIADYREGGLGVSIISCWEIAKLVEKNRLELSYPVDDWLATALLHPNVRLLDLTPSIMVRSTRLAGFHNDPANQLIVATALVYNCPLLTVDGKILAYTDVQILQ
jgi:PIN domain nuclease of toxin-antitoxin system